MFRIKSLQHMIQQPKKEHQILNQGSRIPLNSEDTYNSKLQLKLEAQVKICSHPERSTHQCGHFIYLLYASEICLIVVLIVNNSQDIKCSLQYGCIMRFMVLFLVQDQDKKSQEEHFATQQFAHFLLRFETGASEDQI